jgi:GNAT superfamily N-acetyltransferase
MHRSDIPAGLDLCRLSHWNQLEDDWHVFLESPGGGACLAECRGGTAGTVAFLRYGRSFSWLSMMLVHPDARRAGIGTGLLDAALESLADEPCVRLDATPLGEPLYRRFGFCDEYQLVRATVALPSTRLGPPSECVRPMTDADLPAVFVRDRRVFDADRSALLASFYRRAPGMAWIASQGGVLLGYCFGRPGYLYRQLGPLVAEEMAVAQQLLTRCLAGEVAGKLAVDIPRLAPEWIAWLESAGFRVERSFLRMFRGQTPPPCLAALLFAIAGPEFG